MTAPQGADVGDPGADMFDARPEQWQGATPSSDKHIVAHDFATPPYGTEAPTE